MPEPMQELTAEQVDARNLARLRAEDPERFAVRELELQIRRGDLKGRDLAVAQARIDAWRSTRLAAKVEQRAAEATAWAEHLKTHPTEGTHHELRKEPQS